MPKDGLMSVCHSQGEAGLGMTPPQASLHPWGGGHSGPPLWGHALCMGMHPQECPGMFPAGLAQVFAVKPMAYLGSGRGLPLFRGGWKSWPASVMLPQPKQPDGRYPQAAQGSIFALEDPLSCKSKGHFYYYFQLLHDSYYSSALTSAINNNRIVNHCSF